MTWDHVRGYDPMIATAERFAELHDGVRINWEKRSLQAFADRPLEAMASDYDLMVIDHPHVGSAARSGLLAPFNSPGLAGALAVLADQSCGQSYASYDYEGKQWALPLDAAAPVAVYRPDLLREVPATWNHVIQLAEQSQVIWPLLPINSLMSFFSMLANAGEPFGVSGRGVADATGRRILRDMLAVAKHLPEECFLMDPIWACEWLACRSSHSYIPYAYGYSNYSRNGFRPHLVRVADVPELGVDGPAGSAIGGTGIAVSAAGQHKNIALEYALWIASAECQKDTYFLSGGQPANRLAWEDGNCNAISNDFFQDTIRTLETSWLRPRHDGYMHFQDVAGEIVHACLTRTVAVPTTIDALNQAYERSFT
jgi:multiple sugar transport system substrate-binding protein